MRCPVDGTTLTLAERAGVEIDYCPQCRGVWLDRGELDRIIDRSTAGYDRGRRYDDHRERYEPDRHGHDDHDDRRHQGEGDDRVTGHDQPRRNRSGAFGALADLLGGGDD